MTATPDPSVLVVDLAKRFGGADVRVLQLAEGLRGRSSCTVATLAGSPLHRRLAAAGLPRVPVTRRRGDPRIALDLARAARRGGFGAIDAHNPQSQLWALAAGLLARVPARVTTVHSQYLAEHGGAGAGASTRACCASTGCWGAASWRSPRRPATTCGASACPTTAWR